MNNLVLNCKPEVKTISSLDLLAIINEFRAQAGESVISNTHFLAKVVDELELVGCKFITTPHPQNNIPQKSVFLTHEEATLIGMRESKAVRRAVLKKLNELQSPVIALPQTFAQALLLAAQQAEQLEAQQSQIADLAPKAAALLRFSTAEGEINITLAAKELQVPPKKLFSWLSAAQWIYKRAGGKSWVAYQDRIQQGLLVHKSTVVLKGDGSEKVCDQVLVTAKGLARLSEQMGVAQ